MRRSLAGGGARRATASHRTPRVSEPTRGSVLLETALAIPLLVAVTVALAWGLSIGATAMAMGDAARQVARDVARGVTITDAVSAAQATVPGASIRVHDGGATVTVEVEESVEAPVPVLRGITLPLSQRVVVTREWS